MPTVAKRQPKETIFICTACPPKKPFETPFGNVIADHMIDEHTKTEEREGDRVGDYIKATLLLSEAKGAA